VPADDVAALMDRLRRRDLPWRDRRRIFVETLANRLERPKGEVSQAAAQVWPRTTAPQVLRRLRNRRFLNDLGAERDLVDQWLAGPEDGALTDEVRSRFEGVRARYAHVIVDEAQDLTLLQLRAVQRRADGLTLVGDDAQRRGRHGIGLRRAASRLGVHLEQMDTAYRMSAEIAEWLNGWATRHGIDAVPLVGIRPTGVEVRGASDVALARSELEQRWSNVATITGEDVWVHKGIEYDGVVVDATTMTAPEIYLAASRAAHELVLVGVEA
jgi:superfamily I DNA/RNA helicase